MIEWTYCEVLPSSFTHPQKKEIKEIQIARRVQKFESNKIQQSICLLLTCRKRMRKNIDDTGKAEHKNRKQKLWPMTMGDMRKYLKTIQTIRVFSIKSPTAFKLFSCTISALSKVEKSHPNAFENLGAIKREETPPPFPPLHFILSPILIF